MSLGTEASALVPKTTSTLGTCSRSLSPSRCAMQPPTATTRLPEGGTGALTMADAWPYRRVSAFSRTQQVMKTTTSASSGVATSRSPHSSSRPETRSESCMFIWQPKVLMK